MNYFYWDLNPLSQHQSIVSTFCADCKHRLKKDGDFACRKFIYANGVCVTFEWKNKKAFDEYKDQVLESWAITAYLNKGLPLDKIYALPKKTLLSVLTKDQLTYFERRVEEDAAEAAEVARLKSLGYTSSENYRQSTIKRQDAPAKKIEPPPQQRAKVHYFYAQLPSGEHRIYTRKTTTASYESEIKQFRKYLAKNNIVLLKEEIK